jgi:hypothetical protein
VGGGGDRAARLDPSDAHDVGPILTALTTYQCGCHTIIDEENVLWMRATSMP